MSKMSRNDPCFCGSNKKFKKCCSEKVEELKRQEREKKDLLYVEGHDISSETLQYINDWVKKEYKDFNVIDVTKILTPFNYLAIQATHYLAEYGNTIILAERTSLSDFVFKKRCQKYTNVIIMFKGAYHVFTDFSFGHMEEEIKKMIDLRI